MDLTDLKSKYRLYQDTGDRWGSAMGAWFDIAAELYIRGAVPEEWHYSPGASADPREPDSFFAQVIEDADTIVLREFGNILERYTACLRFRGLDY